MLLHYGRRPASRTGVRVLDVSGAVALAWIVWLAFTLSSNALWLYRGGFAAIALAGAVVIAAATGTGVVRTVLSMRGLRMVGLVSYGVYLYHIPIDLMLSPHRIGQSGVALFAIRVAVVAAFSTASYLLVERPIRSWNGWPRARLAVPVLAVLVLAAFAGSTLGARPVTTTDLLTNHYQRQRLTTPAGAVRVLVAGDSLAASLGKGVRSPYDAHGIHATVVSVYGCGIVDGDLVLGAVRLASPACAAHVDAVYQLALRTFEPEVVVLMLGPSMVYDRAFGSTTLRVGTQAMERFLAAALDRVSVDAAAVHARLVLTTVPCMTPPATGRLARLTEPERDPARIEWLAAVWRRYAASRHVQLIDYEAFLCRDGERIRYRTTPFGAPDGIELTPFGASATWQWIAKSLISDSFALGR